MNFDQLAEVVHDLVQRQNNGETEALKFETFQGLTPKDQDTVIDGFSKLHLSGDSVAIEIGPNVHWA